MAAFIDVWEDFCFDNHVILVGPNVDNENGWTTSDTEFIQEAP